MFLQGNQCVRGRNIEIDKVEVARIEVKNFLSQTFKKYIFQVAFLVAKTYYVSFSFVDATSICESIYFHLGT
jgi:hypothetical protein